MSLVNAVGIGGGGGGGGGGIWGAGGRGRRGKGDGRYLHFCVQCLNAATVILLFL